MARPKKPIGEQHRNRKNITLTDNQDALVQAIADFSDIPYQVALRSLIDYSLKELTPVLKKNIPNHLFF